MVSLAFYNFLQMELFEETTSFQGFLFIHDFSLRGFLVSMGCHSEIPHWEASTTRIHFSQFWRLEVQDEGVSRGHVSTSGGCFLLGV